MNEIEGISTKVHKYLKDASEVRWAHVHFLGQQYSIMTTNIAESLNAFPKDDREYPSVALLDTILMKLLTWFTDRREVAVKIHTKLTTWTEKIVRNRDEMAKKMDVQTLHHFTYFILNGIRNAEVDLNAKTCTCKVFQLDQLPCSHALAASNKIIVSKYGLASKFYTSNALVAAYAEPIHPVGHTNFWQIPVEVLAMDILPPIMRVLSGWRRKNMILSQGEEEVRRKCGRCGGTGHNRKTCKNPIPVPSSSTTPIE